MENKEAVNHPSHYAGKFECIDVMQELYGDSFVVAFCLLNAFKYLWRCNSKGNFKQDLAKARWYIDKCLELCEDEK